LLKLVSVVQFTCTRVNHLCFSFLSLKQDYLLEKWKNEDTRIIWKQKAVESFTLSNKARSLHLSDGIFFCSSMIPKFIICCFYYSSLSNFVFYMLQLYFPSVFDDHWFVFMVDMKYRNFIFLDSYYSQQSSYQKKVANLLVITNFFCTFFFVILSWILPLASNTYNCFCAWNRLKTSRQPGTRPG
jgi:hypothetical protein